MSTRWTIRDERLDAFFSSSEDDFLTLCGLLGLDVLRDLRDADLSGLSLVGTDLAGADLSGADLSGSNLTEASLARADLTRVDLSDAVLAGADLSGAVLRGAKLHRCDLSRANLSNADLSGASIHAAILGGVDLGGGTHRFDADEIAAVLSSIERLSTQFDSLLSDLKAEWEEREVEHRALFADRDRLRRDLDVLWTAVFRLARRSPATRKMLQAARRLAETEEY